MRGVDMDTDIKPVHDDEREPRQQNNIFYYSNFTPFNRKQNLFAFATELREGLISEQPLGGLVR